MTYNAAADTNDPETCVHGWPLGDFQRQIRDGTHADYPPTAYRQLCSCSFRQYHSYLRDWATRRGIEVKDDEGYLIRGRVTAVGFTEGNANAWMRLHTGAIIRVEMFQVALLTRPAPAPDEPPVDPETLEPYQQRYLTYPESLSGWVGRWIEVMNCHQAGVWGFDPTEPSRWERVAEWAIDAERTVDWFGRLWGAIRSRRAFWNPGDYRYAPPPLRWLARPLVALAFGRYRAHVERIRWSGTAQVSDPSLEAWQRSRQMWRRLRRDAEGFWDAWRIQRGEPWPERDNRPLGSLANDEGLV